LSNAFAAECGENAASASIPARPRLVHFTEAVAAKPATSAFPLPVLFFE